MRDPINLMLNCVLILMGITVAIILYSAFFRSPERKDRGK